jgi:hypothetical protein
MRDHPEMAEQKIYLYFQIVSLAIVSLSLISSYLWKDKLIEIDDRVRRFFGLPANGRFRLLVSRIVCFILIPMLICKIIDTVQNMALK